MSHLKNILLLIALTIALAKAKPSHPFIGYHGLPHQEHLDFAPPILPPAHFHNEPAPTFLPAPPPALAPLPPPPAQAPLLPFAVPALSLPSPLPAFHATTHFLPAAPPPPAVLPAPLPLAKVLPPVYEAIPFAAPTYRAIPGPKTTTHSVHIGYAFPTAPLTKVVTPHVHAAPLLVRGGYPYPLF